MSEHKCLHEVDLALMQQDVAYLKEHFDKLLEKFSNGIPTKLAVHDVQLKRLQKFQWALFSLLILAVVGGLLKGFIV